MAEASLPCVTRMGPLLCCTLTWMALPRTVATVGKVLGRLMQRNRLAGWSPPSDYDADRGTERLDAAAPARATERHSLLLPSKQVFCTTALPAATAMTPMSGRTSV
jgi:hypothetical protein